MSNTADNSTNSALETAAETRRIGALLDRQLDLLARLSGSMFPAPTAAPADEIARLERRTRDQREMLTEWMQLEGALGPAMFHRGPNGGSASEGLQRLDRGPQFRNLLVEIRRKCDFEMAMLRRARRTAAALSSLLSVQEPTYAPGPQVIDFYRPITPSLRTKV